MDGRRFLDCYNTSLAIDCLVSNVAVRLSLESNVSMYGERLGIVVNCKLTRPRNKTT